MSVNWTKEQMQVIENRGSNLLVSAAAGSGKTAVLVERIIRMVTEGDHPCDIDRLLVMTFTKAAAAEMRERIGAAIEKKLGETPDNAHLQAQATLVHHAQITTIDSFCLNLIRSHFNSLELDPSFRIGDEGELLLLRGDVMRELLEDYYADGGEDFERFVATYAPGKSDAAIEDYIMQVYTFSQSNPYPGLWLEECRRQLEAGQIADDGQVSGGDRPQLWMQFLLADVRKQAGELALQLDDALEICREDEYLCAYVPMLDRDLQKVRKLADAADFYEVYGCLERVSWDRLATVRSKEVDPEKKSYVTGCRDRVKKAVGKMAERYAFAQPDEMFHDMEMVSRPARMLVTLAEDFSRRYQEKKRERNLVDFSDLEHEALKVLIASEDGRPLVENGAYVYTDAADELSRQYEEVLVDEYQDSNLVQEALLHAVSRERFGQPNVFMVGDVKQSIYKFRLARPELFLEKYHTYAPVEKGEANRKIELHQNFRSRHQVLDGVNDIFYRIMTESLGGIRYTEDAALHPGAEFAPLPGPKEVCGPEKICRSEEACGPGAFRGSGSGCESGQNYTPELLVVDTGTAALSQLDDEAADYTAKELEAKLIVRKIQEMTDPETGLMVWDKNLHGTGGYRTARYGDMVILLRSTSGWTETLLAVLLNEGIPAYAESRMGYFNTIEVETILSLLSVIDNPMQDIPLAAVLKSPVAGLSDEELARMMAVYRSGIDCRQDQNRGIYGGMKLVVQSMESGGNEGKEEPYMAKIRRFARMLETFRMESTYLPIHELIYRVYERTGYYNYVSAMPAGQTRRANLDMLVEKAAAYEKTSYKGLFHFIRYIESLKKFNTDFGEASIAGEEENTVRIMSIHKSKGLEFPVVFLAGMGKKFNRQDTYGKVLIDPELGIAVDYIDLDYRLKATTLKKNVLRRKMELESLGEELRVLYVAMTRAREKLVMTGTDRYLEKAMEKYAHIPAVDGQIPYTILASAGTYLDWVLMCTGDGNARVQVTEIPVADMIGDEMVRQIENRNTRDTLLMLDTERTIDGRYGEMLERYLYYQYPHEADVHLYTKMSVSELKKQGQQVDDGESFCQVPQDGNDDHVKAPSDGGYGATRGTAYHRALELLPFGQVQVREDIDCMLNHLVEEKRYARENLELVDTDAIWRFLQSELGQRMSAAQRDGRLKKEQQFVMGMPAREMNVADTDELVVIQGIIDACFEEGGQLVLVDYKTDRVRDPQILIDHYKKQLDYYERALTQMTGKKVKEKLIYSFELEQVIAC